MAELDTIIDLATSPIADDSFVARCRDQLDADGVVTIPGFIRPAALSALVAEAEEERLFHRVDAQCLSDTAA